jgi:CARDB
VVFNTLCSSNQAVHFVETPGTPDCPQVQAAVWARPGVVYASATNRIYLGTGNGLYAPATFAWGDSVLALTPDGTSAGGSPLDSYTPTNYQSLQNSDLDLGSTAPAILAVPPSSSVAHLAVQGGKDGILRLLNLDNLSGQGGAGHTGGEVSTLSVPQGGEILTQPATWVNPTDGSSWVFVANANGIAGLKLVIGAGGAPSLQAIWQQSGGGSSPVVANNVVYYATNGSVRALAPTTGGSPLWQGTIGGIHWESPIVANGMLYSTDENSHLTGFALPGQPTQTSTPTATATSSVTNSPTATSTATPTRSPLPDLVVRGLTNPPATAHPGSSFTVFDAVFNVGSTTAGSSTTRFYLSADTKRGAGDLRLAGQQSVPSLNPGANAHGLTNVTIPTAVSSGTYYLLGCADDLRQVQEANERNNCSASTTTVQVAP